MDTTIQISGELLKKLQMMKMHNKESYEDIIWDMIEDRLELSKETKEGIEKSRKQIKEGKTISFEDLRAKMRK
jgi:predicted CopG family antitoxin